jgi:hypothetical protein
MRNSAYEDSVNADFVDRVGKHLAAIQAADTENARSIALDDLYGDYESTIGEIPDHVDDWDDDEE